MMRGGHHARADDEVTGAARPGLPSTCALLGAVVWVVGVSLAKMPVEGGAVDGGYCLYQRGQGRPRVFERLAYVVNSRAVWSSSSFIYRDSETLRAIITNLTSLVDHSYDDT